jgi:hypothetical protein
MTIEYDKPFEVTENQYNVLMNRCSGIVAGRKEDGKFFIKCWMMKYSVYVKSVLKTVK